jgi:hypothetical protein
MAFSLMVIFAVAAIAIDLGRLYLTREQLQVAASASASAAALDLPDESAAISSAVDIAGDNMPAAEHGNVLAASDIQIGHWDDEARTFTASGTPANAVRVTTRRDSSAGNPVGSFFGQLLGVVESDLSTTATAALLPDLIGAIGAAGSVDITGNIMVDSYDSSAGSYDSQGGDDGGDIYAGGDVSIGGSAEINGSVHGTSVSSGGSSSVSGDTTPIRRSIEYPSVDISGAEADNDNDSLPLIEQGSNLVPPLDADGNFILTGGTDYDMPPGVYLFNDLVLSGQSSINISGPTDIYLTGDLDTSGGDLINSTGDPNNLRIFMTGGTAVINASIDWYGLLYAPDTEVFLSGSADIYGAVIGANVTASGTGDIHFDEGLDLGDDITLNLPKRSSIVQ